MSKNLFSSSVVRNRMLNDFVVKSVIKECHPCQLYHNQIVFYITSNTLMNIIRMPLGNLETKVCERESKIFIRRNWLIG